MKSRIYEGHRKRFENWCVARDRPSDHPDTLVEYENHLSTEKNLSERYVRGVVYVLKRLRFSGEKKNGLKKKKYATRREKKTPFEGARKSTTKQAEEAGEVPEEEEGEAEVEEGEEEETFPPEDRRVGERANKKLTPEELKKLVDHCLDSYENDECALLILLVVLLPDSRVKTIMSKMNSQDSRKLFSVGNPRGDGKIQRLTEFIQGALRYETEPVFTKKHNTYLIRLKKIGEALFEDKKKQWLNFEMLQRTNRFLKLYGGNS